MVAGARNRDLRPPGTKAYSKEKDPSSTRSASDGRHHSGQRQRRTARAEVLELETQSLPSVPKVIAVGTARPSAALSIVPSCRTRASLPLPDAGLPGASESSKAYNSPSGAKSSPTTVSKPAVELTMCRLFISSNSSSPGAATRLHSAREEACFWSRTSRQKRDSTRTCGRCAPPCLHPAWASRVQRKPPLAHGRTITLPSIPRLSCSTHLYSKMPGRVNVTRKRVVLSGGCGKPIWF